jgi:hypothetical protein
MHGKFPSMSAEEIFKHIDGAEMRYKQAIRRKIGMPSIQPSKRSLERAD